MFEEKEPLEEVAYIGKDVAAEALKIATEEGHAEASKDAQGTSMGEEEIPSDTTIPTMEIEEKVNLQSGASHLRVTIPASSLAMVVAHPVPTAPSSSALAGVNFDKEICRILAPLTQKTKEASDLGDSSIDLAFLEAVAARLKEVRERYD